MQLGLRGGSDFPFVRVAQQHTAHVLFGLAGGSRATAALLSEPITLRRKEAGVRKSEGESELSAAQCSEN